MGHALGTEVNLYHVGRTQFAYLLDEARSDQYEAVLEGALAHLGQHFRYGDVPIPMPACAGLVRFRSGEAAGPDVLRMTLAASHDARSTGQNWAIYSAGTDEAHRRAFALLSDVPRALETPGEFALVYQPRVGVSSSRCLGAEALLRWNHPRHGNIPPGNFIPLVERTALTRPITEWVLNAALRQARLWQDDGLALRVSINVSIRNLDEEDLVDRLKAALRRHAVGPEKLELEFTETALLQDSRRALQRLHDIRALGLAIAIDDFGTGQANLSYLRQLPASILKLDQSFMRSLTSNRADRVIVKTMIGMAHDLGFQVVAEGVETQEEFDLVSTWSADEVQGYFISRPLAAGSVRAWVAAREVARVGSPGAAARDATVASGYMGRRMSA